MHLSPRLKSISNLAFLGYTDPSLFLNSRESYSVREDYYVTSRAAAGSIFIDNVKLT